MPSYRARVGNVELVSVSDGDGDRDPLEIYPDSTIDEWQEYPDLLDDRSHLRPRYGSVVLRSVGKVVLVDTGLQVSPGGGLLLDMRRLGISEESILCSK